MEADRECLAQFKTAAVDSLNAGFEQFHEKEKQVHLGIRHSRWVSA